MHAPAAIVALSLLLSAPVTAQTAQREHATAEYDCRATKTLGDLEDFVTGSTAEKEAMWRSGKIFRVQKGTYGAVEEVDWLYARGGGPFLARFEYDGNPNGSYGVWVWARCLGIPEPR